MSKLILVRHGKTDWNKLGKWTGHAEADLVEEGLEEARKAAEALRSVRIDCAFVADLRRAQQTFVAICDSLGLQHIPTTIHPAIKERNYGIYTGKNKWQIKEEIGEVEFQRIRRGWDVAIPDGESLKAVYERIVPYHESTIRQELVKGKNVIAVSSGNALRALVKHLENISDDDIAELEIGTGEVYVYTIDQNGTVCGKEILASNPNKGKV